MFLHIYGEFRIAKIKSPHLLNNRVISFPPASMINQTSKYEAEVGDFVVSLSPNVYGIELPLDMLCDMHSLLLWILCILLISLGRLY
jgi:hypothetical protein